MTSPPSPGGPLTKPVREAARRPTPRWVGWVLIALPCLAALSFGLGDHVPLFEGLVLVLGAAAAWDWWRFQDRSRTLRAGYLGLILLVSGAVTLVLWRPPLRPALAELGNIAVATLLALALVQLYRSAETVLTLARGWLYLLAGLAGVTVYQRVTAGPFPVTGPFHTPDHLATAGVTGLALMPVGFALEHDRRLCWAYPVGAVCAVEVLWWSGHRNALWAGLLLIALWALQGERSRWVLAGAGLAAATALVSARVAWPLHAADVVTFWRTRARLADLGLTEWAETWFLGAGPSGYDGGGAAGAYSPLVELAAEYGLGAAVVVILAGVGVLRWCVLRLVRTRGLPWASPERAPAVWLGVMVTGAPLAGALQPTWLDVPLTALLAGTLALLARHVEATHGRRPVVGGV
jgi:hypothetical protein